MPSDGLRHTGAEHARRHSDARRRQLYANLAGDSENDDGPGRRAYHRGCPAAGCIPNESIGTERPEALPDPEQIILIYCRSGRRSKEAAKKLFDMGYTRVYEFGGIIDWTGEVVIETAADADAARPS